MTKAPIQRTLAVSDRMHPFNRNRARKTLEIRQCTGSTEGFLAVRGSLVCLSDIKRKLSWFQGLEAWFLEVF